VSIFKVNLVACNPKQREQMTMPLAALVDTGSELTWLPAEALQGIGIEALSLGTVPIAKDITVEREVGYALLRANGSEIAAGVVFARPGDRVRIGTQALAGFGVKMDDRAQRFVSVATLAAFSAKNPPQPLARVA
jgi:predicted aspartyl protease